MAGKVIVITGAFGALGQAAAARAENTGWSVARVDVAPAPPTLAGALTFGGLDLTDMSATANALKSIREKAGRIDALLNIAGGFQWETLADGGVATWKRMFTLNLETTATACKAALPHLAENNSGAIVNVGAAATLKAAAGMGAYTASKAGVAKLTEALANEWRGKVRVNAVLPSIIDTPANRTDMPDADFAAWVRPGDLAAVMLFLASDDARAVTGALVPVTGGVF